MNHDRHGHDHRPRRRGGRYTHRPETHPPHRLLPLLGHPRWLITFGGGSVRHCRHSATHLVVADYSVANLVNAADVLADDQAAGRAFLVRADLNALPFVDAAFDAAVVLRVLHRLPDCESALAEMGRTVGDRWLIDVPIAHPALDGLRGTAGQDASEGSGPAPPGTSARGDSAPNLDVGPVRRLLSEHGWQSWIVANVSNMRRWDRSPPSGLLRPPSPAAYLDKITAGPGGHHRQGESHFLLAQRPTPIPAALAARPTHAPPGVPASATRMTCPDCRGRLSWTADSASCLACFGTYPRTGAYWDFTVPTGQLATIGPRIG